MKSFPTSTASRANEPRTLIDDLIAEQGTLTAVEQFSRAHERHELTESRYRALLPAAAPAPGQQYAFEVDLDTCSGCKACVTACHALNGLDDGESWREVGLLVSDDWRRPFRQVVTTACHHCVEPGCLEGCPVLAYEKDPATGNVRHLDDQCIGCQYCIMMCPYEVPKYSEARGIVRKCDMCAQRLGVGEAPACVQACPNEAIRITVVEQAEVRGRYRPEPVFSQPVNVSGKAGEWVWGTLGERPTPHSPTDSLTHSPANSFLPASPDPAITLPTTRFVSATPLPGDLLPANATEVRLQPAHWPLVWMLVLTQLGVGAFATLATVPQGARLPLAVLGLAATLAGIAASVMHLGRPLKAWRSFLGLRQSWLSREIVAFACFALLAFGVALEAGRRGGGADLGIRLFASAAALAGLAGVGCSGMVYHATQRVFWRGARSVGKFFGTTAVLGLASAWMAMALFRESSPLIALCLVLVTTVKLAGEHRLLRRAESDRADEVWPKDGAFDSWSLAHSAVLMRDKLGLLTRLRFGCGIAGGVLQPLFTLLRPEYAPALAVLSLALCVVGELIERSTFFRAVVPPRMPVASHS